MADAREELVDFLEVQRFVEDVHSQAARQVNRELERLPLPRLPDLEDEFLKLCDRLGVS